MLWLGSDVSPYQVPPHNSIQCPLSKKLLPPAFNLACLLTLCLLFSLLTGSFILLKLLFSKFTMTSSLRWIVVRSLHSFFSTYLLLLILSIIPASSFVFKIGLVLMVFLFIGSHLISRLAFRQSQSTEMGTRVLGLGLESRSCWTRTWVLHIWTRTRDMRTRTRLGLRPSGLDRTRHTAQIRIDSRLLNH